ncbi:MAG: DUF6291 domain-containing protein [Bacteroidales bacterium]|nr:DUF6291 domain-containing protein [Bacteroidales bacterium]
MDKSDNTLDSFVFYPSFRSLIKGIPNEKAKIMLYDAIADYGIEGLIPDFSEIDPLGVMMAIFNDCKKLIDQAKAHRKEVSKKRRNARFGISDTEEQKATNVDNCQQMSTNADKITKSQKSVTNVNGIVNDIANGIENDSGNNSLFPNVKSEGRKNTKCFSPPTLEELKKYISENQYQVSAEMFFDYYTSNGWQVGRNKMKDWKASVRQWHYRDNTSQTNNSSLSNGLSQQQAVSYANKKRTTEPGFGLIE